MRKILDADTQKKSAKLLQNNLLDLIDLSLQGKQAHWNVRGRNFRSVHLELDEIIDAARLAADEVAERMATIGVAPDGLASSIAGGSKLEPFPQDFVAAEKTISLIADRLESTIKRLRKNIDELDQLDPVSQDMLIDIASTLEKHMWMIQSQEA